MAHKKKPAKEKRSHHSGDERPMPKGKGKLPVMTICLPCEPDSPPPKTPEEIVVAPVVITAPVEPLPEAVKLTRCTLTVHETWWLGTPYVVIAAAKGSTLPPGLKSGQLVDVQFLPPPPTPSNWN